MDIARRGDLNTEMDEDGNSVQVVEKLGSEHTGDEGYDNVNNSPKLSGLSALLSRRSYVSSKEGHRDLLSRLIEHLLNTQGEAIPQ